jgi:hypothetical protein
VTESQDPDRAPEETPLEQLLELAALTAEPDGLGPADILRSPETDDDLG